ncbi:hypothetical protein TanjilG_08046 [Lupinus angustifolius]|uniref:OPA3-like protein n=1 Tax=Lupinus angustifolius TaxID=3871 RepID=A0A4P1RM62_LUPAN|nr:hypothetical protein TanjilG_08046 [Lupinus angustifolius]
MVLPFLKLGTLALKTLSKPVASRIKKQAGTHPRFREFIVNMAQANHQISTKMQRRIYGHATDVKIHPLNEEKAIQAAVDLIGEIFVFSVLTVVITGLDASYKRGNKERIGSLEFLEKVGVVLLILEVQRSSRSEARKEELRRQELGAVKQVSEDLAKEVEILKEKIQEVEQLARGRGLSGVLNFRQSNTEIGKAGKAA